MIATLLFTFLVVLLTPIFAQVVDPPGSIWDAVASFKYLIGSFPGAVALLFFLVPFALGAVNATGKFIKYLLTTLIVAAVAVLAHFLPFGFLYGVKTWGVVFGGGLLMLVQVGIFSVQFAKEIQEKIYDKWNPWKS